MPPTADSASSTGVVGCANAGESSTQYGNGRSRCWGRRFASARNRGKARGARDILAVFPQGVRGYLMARVRPPWGWSLGLRTVPRTVGRKPRVRRQPALRAVKVFALWGCEPPKAT